MLIFDQLKKNDPQLRLLAVVVGGSMLLLLAVLWWMQIVSAREYRANLDTQSFRTVRIPAVRGKIFDRNNNILAENKPSYNVSLYLEDLREQFRGEYARLRPIKIVTNPLPFWKPWLGISAVQTQNVRLGKTAMDALQLEAHCKVVSNSVQQVCQRLQLTTAFDLKSFKAHYERSRPLPYPVARDINSVQIARFEEQLVNPVGMDLDVQATRFYPQQSTAAHLLGYLRYDDDSLEGEASFFSYRLPDFSGVLGVEAGYDKALHGRAGAKSVLINNLGYRQTENIWTPAEPGSNVVLTIDLPIQQGVEAALQSAKVSYVGPPRGAAVVMDVRTGDILAMASSPTFNPNLFVRPQGLSNEEYQRIQTLTAEKNRASQENYQPGSIFKTIVAMACLDRGLDPEALYEVKANPKDPDHGITYVREQSFRDLARPGLYNFKKALIHSSNAYFIDNGLRAGIDSIVRIGERLHLGETTGLANRQENGGHFPNSRRIHSRWYDGDTANVCIGQGYVDVTPIQMAVLACAIANGGKVLWPRLVDRIEPQDLMFSEQVIVTPKGRVRDNLGVKPRTLQILQKAMLADTEEPEGTAYDAFRSVTLPKTMRVCGKTGTAQQKDERGGLVTHFTWFLSFAPYESPRYAVVVMVEGGSSGGGTCAPVALKIYETLAQREQTNAARTAAIAQIN